MGLRVLDLPLVPGIAIVSGLTGEHPVMRVEAAARAPYPVAGDIGIGGIWVRAAQHRARFLEQRYDFASGELTTRFAFDAEDCRAEVEVLTFCSRSHPTVVAQEIGLTVDAPADVSIRAMVDPEGIPGRWLGREMRAPGGEGGAADGSLAWETLGGMSRVGAAYATEFRGSDQVERKPAEWGEESPIATDYTFRARRGRRYAVRQLTSLVPSVLHRQPDRQAVRLVSQAADEGFDEIRRRNRAAWDELWLGRIRVESDDRRWQEITDAALYYLFASTHSASPASTSIFGLAQWTDYHYYYGHVMWDIETFSVPPLSLLNPPAARSLLGFRERTMPAARRNAQMHAREGLQFPWEAAGALGEEAAPGPGTASWHEDHVSLDVAWAFAHHAHATGDREFLADRAWPVLRGVADWTASRVQRSDRGFELPGVMGIAERKTASNNEAFTAMAATVVLRDAIAAAGTLGRDAPPRWSDVADGLVIPTDAAGGHVISYDGWRPNHEKGATPAPLAGFFPYWYDADPKLMRATIERYLALAPGYIGSPMLSALYGVWACWIGDRAGAARLLDEGYAAMHAGRYLQQLEQDPKREPDKPRAGPFFANIGGFVSSLLFGLPGIRVGPGDPSGWARRAVVLPAGWDAVAVERAWVRGEPTRIEARQGEERARLEPIG